MPPDILYKYLKPEGGIVFLETPQLWFSDWRTLDDLMEILPGQRPLNEEEAHQYALKQMREYGINYAEGRNDALTVGIGPEWERTLRKMFLAQPCTLFLCCLTARWNSGAMWAMYADRHKGVAIGFSVKNLPPRITAGLGKVKYDTKRPTMPLKEEADHEVLAEAAITKSTDWDYQEEYRAVSGTGAIEYLKAEMVAEIVVGHEASAQIIKQTLAFKRKHPATKVYHAFPHLQKHEMDRIELFPSPSP